MGRSATPAVSLFFFSSRGRHTRWPRDWSSDVCSSDLVPLPDGTVTPGKEVVEFSVIDTSKGDALEALARASAADAWLYLGDDVTDESVFARLGDDDMGVKVGGGDTSATHRITGTDDARHLLEKLVRARRELG